MISMKLPLILFCALTLVLAREGYGPTDQKWGYVTIRPDASIFWWLHHTTAKVSSFNERPLVIWLQGGPGAAASGYGNFAEIGPLDLNLTVRPNAWTNDLNVLFVDSPVGTGFSDAQRKEDLPANNTQIAKDFLVVVKEFFKENPEFVKTPLYIFSESYGGKMAVEIALTIDKARKAGELACNLTGVALGDPWISPADSIKNYAPYLLQLGLVDAIGYNQIVQAADKVNQNLDEGNYPKANDEWKILLRLINNVTNGVDIYNVLNNVAYKARYDNEKELARKLYSIMNFKVKSKLNLDVTWYAQTRTVREVLHDDLLKPATALVEELLSTTDIKVAIYNGQLDLVADTAGTVAWVDKLKWSNKAIWAATSSQPLVNEGYVEGYYKKVGNLALYVVDRAGVRVPSDNPQGMELILKDVTGNYQV